jgi:hypothetical protein
MLLMYTYMNSLRNESRVVVVVAVSTLGSSIRVGSSQLPQITLSEQRNHKDGLLVGNDLIQFAD